MASEHKSYLGDGVYADFDGYAIILTTENGIEMTNRIVLEPPVLVALEKWVDTALADDEDSEDEPEKSQDPDG